MDASEGGDCARAAAVGDGNEIRRHRENAACARRGWRRAAAPIAAIAKETERLAEVVINEGATAAPVHAGGR